ncbi:carboxypeptidase-like regulatory domain-containing protein [Streptomyces niger]|uniref:carboxypeptidase-like regulatory domain-containing protein n=1 Tax=Streptomyces niger TaxID=66373 RepID=UPI0018FE2EC0|nr:carboxypeptidase-like regulatory domain-containing protein [Streptomyces niger]
MSETGPAPAALLNGVVRNASGAPVADARVFFTESPQPLPDIAVLTDGAGRFTLTVPAPGDYTLACHAELPEGASASGEARVHVVPGPSGSRSAEVWIELRLA